MAATPIKNLKVKYTQIFYNNEFHNSVSGKTFPTINPCTEEKICDVQEADKADVDLAVAAARKAFEVGSEWRSMDASQRGRLLYKLADLVERDRDYLFSLESIDNGKPFSNSSVIDFGASVGALRYFAGWADKNHGYVIPADGKVFSYTRHEPIGVVGAIIPWNFPMLLTTQDLGPALATGNCILIKPAEQTPLTALYFAALCKEVGFPPGVVSVLPGYGPTAGAAIASHMDIDKVCFTGSVETGRIVADAANKSNMKRTLFELGGKSPVIIFADADIDTAVNLSVNAVMANAGQICCAPTRTFVQDSIYDEFVKKAKAVAGTIKVGDPFEADTFHGPQVSDEQFDKVLQLIESGKKEGATCEIGGERLGTKGYFIKPTVFSNVTDEMRIAKEEIFGPVMQIMKFSEMNEVLRRANNTNYGLAAGIITKDIDKAYTVAHSLQAGSVWINTFYAGGPQTPFGGFKSSGKGRVSGEYAIKEFTEVKSVVTAIPIKIS